MLSKSKCQWDNQLCEFGAQETGMPPRYIYNFDASYQQMIFNATETAKIPVRQSVDIKKGSNLQGKSAKS